MKAFFKNIDKNYSIIRLIKYSIVVSALLLVLDIFNLPSKYIADIDSQLLLLASGFVFAFFLLTLIEMNFFDAFKIPSVNVIDAISIVSVISSGFYCLILAVYSQLFIYKLLTIICVVIIFSITILVRGTNWKKAEKHAEKYKTNVLDLKDIFTGNFNIEEDNAIILDEKDVDYDLLDRDYVINQLYNAVLQCNPEGRFVISLEGKWGSGKTTILNNVKCKLIENSNNIVIIDEFDPWTYSDQESLFLNMFDIILQKSGFKYSTLLTNIMIRSLSESIIGSQTSSLLFLKRLFNQPNIINSLKNKINEYLKLCGKKIVFFIDNIDRAESDNIIFLFKLVGNVLDFERVTYVLSFDDSRVKKIFDNKLEIDYEYLKKVIQMQILVPEIDINLKNNLLMTCLDNLLMKYGETEQSIKEEYHSVISYICKLTNDIRDFKRFVNSVISTPFKQGSFLCKRDLFAIQYIRLNNIGLYHQIYKNRVYFVSHDKMYDSETFKVSLEKKKFNDKAKEFYENLFSEEKNRNYRGLLSEIFPYVKRYSIGHMIEYDGFFSDEEYDGIAKNRNICSAKYFDLYFTSTENVYLQVGKTVERFVAEINNAKDIASRREIFLIFLNAIHKSVHKEVFERLQLYTEDFLEDAKFDMVTILFDNIHRIDDSLAFFALNAQKRAVIIIWDLLQLISEDFFRTFMASIEHEYGKIEIISNLLYWFEHDREGKGIEERKQKLDALYRDMGERIISNSINLYNDPYYSHRNIHGLFKLYQDEEMKLKSYIKEVINESNIFRLLYDIMVLSSGSKKVTYSISKANINILSTEEDIDKIIMNATPISEDQQFILDVYKKYKSGLTDEFGEAGITIDDVKTLNP